MKRDRRPIGVLLTIAAVVVMGGLLTLLPESRPLQIMESHTPDEAITKQASIDPAVDPKGHERQARKEELRVRFQQAVSMLHAKQYDYAVKSLHRVLELNPRLPEAHVNMGYALIGLKEYKAAADFFDTATTLKPMQTNAYYGLALAYEGQHKFPLALSAMESFIHLVGDNDPYLNKARAASWEWGEKIRVAKSGEPAPKVVGRDIETKELVNKNFGEE